MQKLRFTKTSLTTWIKRIAAIILSYLVLNFLYGFVLFNDKSLTASSDSQTAFARAALITVIIATVLYYIGRQHGAKK